MEDFIGNNVRFIIQWGQVIAIGTILLSGTGLFFLIRKNRYFLPKGLIGWIGSFILLLVIAFSSLVFMKVTSMKPATMAIINELDSLVGQKAPPLAFQLESDSTHSDIHAFQGQIILLNLWATWCPPCLKEMPHLNDIQKKYADQDVQVIAFSDEDPKRIQKYSSKFPFEALSVYGTSFPWANMKSERPVTFLIDDQGIIVDYFTGGYDFEFFDRQIQRVISGS